MLALGTEPRGTLSLGDLLNAGLANRTRFGGLPVHC